jgi:adenylate kinase family enzyme
MQHKYTVISLVGRTGSGKSTLSRKLAKYLRTSHIEGSDVAKDESGLFTKVDLAERISNFLSEDPEWFGREIAKNIERRLEDKNRTVVVLSGIRQIETCKYLRDHYNVYAFEVRAEMPVRYQRCIEDGKFATAHEFLKNEIMELDMGIQEVEDDAPFAIPTSPLTNPDRIIRATAKLLRSKGATLR